MVEYLFKNISKQNLMKINLFDFSISLSHPILINMSHFPFRCNFNFLLIRC